MRGTLYARLAWDGLRKNRQLSRPYLLTCVCMVAMHYILAFMASPSVESLIPHGGSTVAAVMALGSVVCLLFSLIFLFYTYSFLNRRRAKEFGLYNVLGMGKRELARIVRWESLMTTAIALTGGLALGVALSKAAELGLVNLMGGAIDYRLRFDGWAFVKTVVCYALIFALNALAATMRTARGSAVSLLRSESVGEKPPRGNWLLAGLGFVTLTAAYGLALAVRNPIDALMWFFIAVLLVIAATYMLMISGSVWLCRRLQRNRDYYYQPRHFVSVSSMAYRMKRNGAGLASICIIATMVLVILSTTTCLWFGAEDAIRDYAPREINLTARLDAIEQLYDWRLSRLRDMATDCAASRGGSVANALSVRSVYLVGAVDGAELQCDFETVEAGLFHGALREVFLIDAADCAGATGTTLTLSEGEAAILTDRCQYAGDALTIAMGDAKRTFRVASVRAGRIHGTVAANMPALTVIVPDLQSTLRGFPDMDKLTIQWRFGFDTGLDDEANIALEQALSKRLEAAVGDVLCGYTLSSRAGDAVDFRASYVGLLFIGVMLSIVFLLAAVLIVYYKQVSEGYEDAKRFDIMRKVGMTKQEIRGSIASQLLMVFALPLALAGLHLTFAFPMIRKVLMMMGLRNIALFVRTTLLSFAVFAAFYAAVYRLTSDVYYRIVSGAGDQVP